ncbi:ankyrin repeat protein [Pandoravirus inopinatum]|uniref:Ankyrin repeat protein n=1 Tax=Pandoravirus inopinatum TaxID=1605721 RepID=A0A0B5J658_9VIRU|nr:ankyrin repeat protein [Pandoravirus inopinatum]AJF97190.1 ankyrin repeat protein [Pandoravirus inopinatum]
MDCLHYAFENGCPHNRDAALVAARIGWLDGIQYMESHGITSRQDAMCREAAIGGHAHALQYMIDKGFTWKPSLDDLRAALGFESLDVLCLLLQRADTDLPVARKAAHLGRPDALRLVHQAGWRLDKLVCDAAAAAGDLACLTYAFEHGCRWTHLTTHYALETDSVECLAYAHEHGAPWHYDMINECIRNKARRCLAYAVEHGCPMP